MNANVSWAPFYRLEVNLSELCIIKSKTNNDWYIENRVSIDGPYENENILAMLSKYNLDEHLLTTIREIVDLENFKEFVRATTDSLEIENFSQKYLQDKQHTSNFIKGFMISPEDHCSAGCAYCYAKKRFDNSLNYKTSGETLFTLFDYIRRNSNENGFCGLTIGGGGDTVENFDFYLQALDASKSYNDMYGFHIPIYIATIEPSFLKPEMIETIAKNQDWITLSVDGDPNITYHRPRRIDVKKLLDDYGSICHWAASAVFTAKTAKHISYNYSYLYDAGFEAIQMRPARLSPNHPLYIKSSDFDIAVNEYCILMQSMEKKGIVLEFLSRLTSVDSLGGFLLRYLSESAIDLRCGAGVSGAFVDPNGDIFPCSSTASYKNMKIGNIYQDVIALESIDKVHLPASECESCYIREVCGGICAYESLLVSNRLGIANNDICKFQRDICEIAIKFIQKYYNSSPKLLHKLLSNLSHLPSFSER